METPSFREFVDELRGQWKLLWRNRIDDKVRAEGIANKDYSKLFVEQGTIIIATRDFKPPDFVEIVEQHAREREIEAERAVPPSPSVGGWGKFARTVINKQRRLTSRRAPPKPIRKKLQQLKKGGRGWLHSRMN